MLNSEQDYAQAKLLIAQFFELLGLSVRTHIDVAPDGALLVTVEGEHLAAIIGYHGDTLYALELLLGLLIKGHLGQWTPVMLEAGGWRAVREQRLKYLADRIIEQVRQTSKPHALEPMDPAERRTIHMYLQSFGDVVSESEGEGRDRRIVIRPRASTP